MSVTLPKRFYERAEATRSGDGWAVQLDGKPARTPAKAELAFRERPLAEAIASEWAGQGETIDPRTMPLTRLANSALDGVAGREEAVIDDICAYAGADLLCYRAGQPQELAELQAQHWDPVLEWAAEALDARFVVVEGVVHQAQPDASLQRVRSAIEGHDALSLAALHVIASMTGSVLLALALDRGSLDPDSAWAAAHVDENWQISQWGEDAEAAGRRAARRVDFDAAVLVLRLSGTSAG